MALTDEDKQWIIEQRTDDRKWMTRQLADDRHWMTQQLEIVNTKIEHVETTLLTQFHKWASPAEMRARTHSAAIRTLDMEVEAIDDRVTKLEHPPS